MSALASTADTAATAGDLVLDVSLSCAWCFADQASDGAWAILEQLQTHQAHVPALRLWETANVLVQAKRRGRISRTAADLATLAGLARPESNPLVAATTPRPAMVSDRSSWPPRRRHSRQTPPSGVPAG
jgi:hypothetical protein